MTDFSKIVIGGRSVPGEYQDGFELLMCCPACVKPWTAFAGEGVAPLLSDLIRQAEEHDCTGS